MQSLRVLHVTPYFADAWAYGGIPRLAHSLVRGLSRRGHRVTVCTTDAGDASARLDAPRYARTDEGVDVWTFANASNHLAYHWQLFIPLGLDRYLSRHASSFDVAHLHACRNLPGAIAAYHLRRKGVPYVLAPNGTAPRIERRRAAKLAFDLVAGRRVIAGAARVLAVSNAEDAQLRALGIEASSIRTIPNPVDLDEFAPPPIRGEFRRRQRLGAGPVVMYLGKLTPRKRLDIVAHAFARLRTPDARLVIAGNDMGSGASTRELIISLGLQPRTVFTGLLSGRARLEALADADVVVYPSEHEIFGLVPLESLLAGTPVVVANDSGCGEIVQRAGGRVVPLGDADALAHAVDCLLDQPVRARADAAAAAQKIRDAYGAQAVCAQIEALYGEMLGHS
jgi:glycosyltransferase involved in cell wall biosynthesis